MQPWLKDCWCLPPQASGPFVAQMEEVLDVYMRPEDPDYPPVCMDEASKQLVGETRTPLPTRPGDVAHYDYEYVRNGVANLFIFFAPLLGWRHVQVTERRTRVDWAYAMRDLVDIYFPTARKIRVVLDNLNTHLAGSLYEAFPPQEARRILDRRIPDQDLLRREIAAWEAPRNSGHATMEWRFTTPDARIKLKHLYPVTMVRQAPAATPPPLPTRATAQVA